MRGWGVVSVCVCVRICLPLVGVKESRSATDLNVGALKVGILKCEGNMVFAM